MRPKKEKVPEYNLHINNIRGKYIVDAVIGGICARDTMIVHFDYAHLN